MGVRVLPRQMAVLATASAALAHHRRLGQRRSERRVPGRHYIDRSGVAYYSCVPPNTTHGFGPGLTVTGIRIETQPNC
ncbi:hypothetical protein [Streptomyces lanatus]|uniref:Secreted protein n=1 Tax=Streptomyces lanatus TaxID=66900 RepID=A0ABV1XIZ7_9ACTN|nr:hypothetical protein [Streptomyces lanatus]GHG91769.1 hypothetical protein GCM10018780_12640 [Streptomyces lanatus]